MSQGSYNPDDFWQGMNDPNKDRFYVLRLYVTGSTPKSLRAIAGITALCEQSLSGCCDLDVVDIDRHPERGTAEQLIATPTLVKSLPQPLRRLVGDISNEERVLVGIDVHER